MKIETTVNIKEDFLDKLDDKAKKISKSKSFLIIHLLKQLRKDQKISYSVFSRTGYQVKKDQKEWKQLHVMVNANEYELFLDMRKLFKKSVSWLVAFAIEKYLDCVIWHLQQNYHFELTDNYLLTLKENENGFTFHISWGFPNRKILENLLN